MGEDMHQYLELVRDTLEHGDIREDRTGVGTTRMHPVSACMSVPSGPLILNRTSNRPGVS